MRAFIDHARLILNFNLFTLGGNDVTVWRLFYFSALLALLFSQSGRLGKWLVRRTLSRRRLQPGVIESVQTLTRYAIVVIGLVTIMSTSGVNLSGLALLAGSLGIGVGFGLQNVVTNLAAGLVILLERPIKVGDQIEVGDVHGRVAAIGARATTIQTNDNVTIIVPNGDFITGKVVNWTHGDATRRFRIPVGVSYRENPERVRDVLLEVAQAVDGVESHPTPEVWFDAFGDSSLNFDLWVWTTVYTDRPARLKSQLYYAIFQRFRSEGIEIPFPQMDVHFDREPPKGPGDANAG